MTMALTVAFDHPPRFVDQNISSDYSLHLLSVYVFESLLLVQATRWLNI